MLCSRALIGSPFVVQRYPAFLYGGLPSKNWQRINLAAQVAARGGPVLPNALLLSYKLLRLDVPLLLQEPAPLVSSEG